MNLILGKLPLFLEVVINGFFVVIYTLQKTKKFPELLKGIPVDYLLTISYWVVPLVMLITLASNFLKSEGLEEFLRKYVFSLIVFIPMIITWGDLEFLYWLSAVHLFSSVISIYEKKDRSKSVDQLGGSSFLFRLKLQPAQVLLLSFAGWIFLGALVLVLPVSSVTGKSVGFLDALFMSTSATCVTGLSTISVQGDLSVFGQMVLLILCQVGGLGIMTLSSSLAVIMGRNLQMREQVIMHDVLDTSNSQELMQLVSGIIKFTFIIELVGALILAVGFYQEGFEIGQSIYYGFYHSIMAFCNSGFALFDNNLEDFKFSPVINFTIAFLIIFGGIGFAVLKDLQENIRSKRSFKALSVHSKIVLTVNVALIGIGTVYFFFGEFLNAFQDMGMWQKFQVSFFQAVTPRTAGFSTIDINTLHPHCIYLIILLMFIGASPGSTGGGVKVTTFAVLLQSVTATVRGKHDVEFFERRMPQVTVVKSIAIFIIALIVVSVGVLVMLRLEPDKSFLSLLFEVTSSVATAGLSLGITPFLSNLGKMVIIILMFLGRVGPLTLVIAVGSRVVLPNKIEYPEGKVLIG